MGTYEKSANRSHVGDVATGTVIADVSTPLTSGQTRAIFAAAAGTIVEYTDWLIYASFAPVIAANFFSAGSQVASLLAAFAVFAVGFVMRPIGGAFLGIYADRYGRRKALTLSISLMAGSSAIIGLCPAYDSIGIAATIVLVIARLTQGFSAGGEYGSATAFMIESSPDDRRGFAGSWQWWAINAGILLSSLIAIATLSIGSSLGLASSGWRLAFIFAGVLGLIGLWIRLSVDETVIFSRHRKDAEQRRPIYEVIFKYPVASLRVIGLAMVGNVTGYIWIILYPSYISTTTGMPLRDALTAQSIAVALSLILIPFLGALSDRIGRRPILIAFAFATALYAWPSLELPHQGSTFWEVLALECIALIIFSGYCSTVASTMAEQFPTEIRATGISLPYAIAVTVFGGASPWLVTVLKNAGYGHLVWIYVAVVAVIGGILYIRMPETKGKPIQ